MHILKYTKIKRFATNVFPSSRGNKEKIELLRKKYDDFLEEDKKRRERNDDILGRLEKMRSCGTTVEIYNKKQIPTVWRSATKAESLTRFPLNISNHIIHPSEITPNNISNMLEENLLQKISEKFILIPKTNSSYREFHNVTEDFVKEEDWKNKYNILNELKREEKGEYQSDMIPTKLSNNINLNKTKEANPPHKKELENLQNNLNYETNIGSLDSNKVNNLPGKCNEMIENCSEEQKIVTPTPESDRNDHMQYGQEITTKLELQQLHDTGAISNNSVEQSYAEEPENYAQFDEEQNLHSTNNKYEDNQIEMHQEHFLNTNDEYNLEQVKDPTGNPENVSEMFMSEKDAEDDVNRSKIEEEHQNRYVTNESYQSPEQNIEMVETEKNIIDNNEAQINEFETEQKEMFYSEQANKSFENNEGTAINSDYTAGNNYMQYSTYEGSQDNIYPVEINEHEETTENYDPNYEQQYLNTYENSEYLNKYENEPSSQYSELQAENVNYDVSQQENVQHGALTSENLQEVQSEINYEQNPEYQDKNVTETGYVEQINERMRNENLEDVQHQLDVEDGYEKIDTVVVDDILEENVLKMSSEQDAIPETEVH